jgi:hypothetical protein
VRAFGTAAKALHRYALSPDGRLLAAASGQGEVRLLETATGTEIRRLSGHRGAVWSLAFSRDGRTLVSGSFDGTALVWDVTGRAFADKPQAALSDADLENLWTDLGAAGGREGYGALWAFVRSGKQGIDFLQTRLPHVPDGPTVARLIVQLDDDAFAVREKASRALTRMGSGLQTLLKEELDKKPSPEVRRRIEAILEKVRYKGDARRCGLRSVAVLEYADLPEARTLLQRLAGNDPSEEIRGAARGALKRLENAASRPGIPRGAKPQSTVKGIHP